MPVPSAISRSPLGRLLGLTPPQIVGAIDEPGPRQPYARTLDVRGWALSTDGHPIEVVIEVDGRAVWTAPPDAARADVAAAVPAGHAGRDLRLLGAASTPRRCPTWPKPR